MPDELNLDPFERTYIGPHNAFLLRVHRKHRDDCVAGVKQRHLREMDFTTSAPKEAS